MKARKFCDAKLIQPVFPSIYVFFSLHSLRKFKGTIQFKCIYSIVQYSIVQCSTHSPALCYSTGIKDTGKSRFATGATFSSQIMLQASYCVPWHLQTHSCLYPVVNLLLFVNTADTTGRPLSCAVLQKLTFWELPVCCLSSAPVLTFISESEKPPKQVKCSNLQ